MTEMRYIKAINDALREEMISDDRVFIIGEDIGHSGGPFSVTRGLYDEFGEMRVRETPISEAGIMGLAVGAAATGLRPVVEIMFFDFITVCWDQVVNQAAKWSYMSGGKVSLPLVIRTQIGAGRNAGPQHSQSFEAWCMHVPGLKVVMPSTPYDAKGLLKASIRDDNPVVFIENRILYGSKGEVPDEQYLIPLGQADVKRVGSDVTVVATSQMVQRSLKAASVLAGEGISVEVIDPRTLTPLDMETIISSVKKTSRLVVVQEAVTRCGMGAEIASSVMEQAFDYLDAPVKRVGAPFCPPPFSKPMENYYLPGEESIMAAIKEVV